VKYTKIVLLLLVLSSCATPKIEGHWESNENDDAVVIGLLIKSDRKCEIYVAPPNHSTFVGNCEYQQTGDKFAVYEILYSGKGQKNI
jgi:hypothetical protein